MSWQRLKDELDWDDVGGRLLANLAKGIYNHEAVLREYVQNARDAYHALDALPDTPRIVIRSEGTDISIHDDGSGMDEAEIRQVKKIAVSNKNDLDEMAGFRGIGIWAGFEACDKLEVLTKKQGHDRTYRLEIDFKDILANFDQNINIKKLVDPRYRIDWEGGQPKEEHYTRVKLHSIRGEFSRLLDPDELTRIASQLLPCPIDPRFEHHTELLSLLEKIPTYQEFNIKVADKDGKLQDVYRSFPSGVERPELQVLKNANGADLAYAWYCRTRRTGLKERDNELRGFRLRIHNIAVGRINVYDDSSGAAFGISKNEILKTTNRLPWFCGEIHVVSNEIRPDTPRRELETGSISKSLIEEIRGFYKQRIDEAGALSEFNGHNDALDDAEKVIAEWPAAPPPIDSRLAHRREALLKRLEEDFRKAKAKNPTGPRKILKTLLNRIDVKTRRKKVLDELQGLVTSGREAVKHKEEPKDKPAEQGPAEANTKNQKDGQLVTVDSEELLSEIIAILEKAFIEESDTITVVVREIAQLLEAQAAKNAA